MKAQKHIDTLKLERHIEGGHFRETYLCDTKLDDRSIASSIYFLIEQGDFSAFHIIGQDEQWVHVEGEGMCIHMITDDGEYTKVIVGTDYESGQMPNFVVPANTYFASEALGEYSLVVCNVFPAFRYEDFLLCKRDEFVKMFPKHKDTITRLTR